MTSIETQIDTLQSQLSSLQAQISAISVPVVFDSEQNISSFAITSSGPITLASKTFTSQIPTTLLVDMLGLLIESGGFDPTRMITMTLKLDGQSIPVGSNLSGLQPMSSETFSEPVNTSTPIYLTNHVTNSGQQQDVLAPKISAGTHTISFIWSVSSALAINEMVSFTLRVKVMPSP